MTRRDSYHMADDLACVAGDSPRHRQSMPPVTGPGPLARLARVAQLAVLVGRWRGDRSDTAQIHESRPQTRIRNEVEVS